MGLMPLVFFAVFIGAILAGHEIRAKCQVAEYLVIVTLVSWLAFFFYRRFAANRDAAVTAKLKLALVLGSAGLIIASFGGSSDIGTPPQTPRQADTTQAPKKQVSSPSLPKQDASLDELRKITVKLTLDYGAVKGKSTKYVVEIQNTSDKRFSGRVSIAPTTARIMERVDFNIPSLLPGEKATFFSFAEIKPNTQFEQTIAGDFSSFDSAKAVEYEIIKTMPGNGYMTFWIYTQDVSQGNLITIAKDMRQKYSSLSLGFQIRFFSKRTATHLEDNVAAYALTKHLGLSRLTIFDEIEDIILDNII